MTTNATASGIAAILLDVEGTTTAITFVTNVLFPYARKHVRTYLEQHAALPEHEALLAGLREDHASISREGEAVPPWIDEPEAARLTTVVRYVEWLMDRDRKSTALKELQGKIWEIGYRRGDLVGEVFPDVPRALQRWREQSVVVGIFSSGSVLAQQLLFHHSSGGDLTKCIRSYFDTRIGTKVDPESYRRIAMALGFPTHAVLFLSDVPRELDAAREADMHVRLVIRPGNALSPEAHRFAQIATFDELVDTGAM